MIAPAWEACEGGFKSGDLFLTLSDAAPLGTFVLLGPGVSLGHFWSVEGAAYFVAIMRRRGLGAALQWARQRGRHAQA